MQTHIQKGKYVDTSFNKIEATDKSDNAYDEEW